MKNKVKTHKSTAKRFKITASGKVMRTKRKNRNSRFSRNNNSKDSNTDTKALKLSKIASKRVKNLLNK